LEAIEIIFLTSIIVYIAEGDRVLSYPISIGLRSVDAINPIIASMTYLNCVLFVERLMNLPMTEIDTNCSIFIGHGHELKLHGA
jgi:hypothetical protein